MTMWEDRSVRMLLIASSSGWARSGSMSRPASYCLSIARSMSARARSAARSSPDTGTANVSPGASMRAFAAMASVRAPRSSALTRGPLIESDNSEASTHRLPAAYPILPFRGSSIYADCGGGPNTNGGSEEWTRNARFLCSASRSRRPWRERDVTSRLRNHSISPERSSTSSVRE